MKRKKRNQTTIRGHCRPNSMIILRDINSWNLIDKEKYYKLRRNRSETLKELKSNNFSHCSVSNDFYSRIKFCSKKATKKMLSFYFFPFLTILKVAPTLRVIAWVLLPRARHSLIINYNQSIILSQKETRKQKEKRNCENFKKGKFSYRKFFQWKRF